MYCATCLRAQTSYFLKNFGAFEFLLLQYLFRISKFPLFLGFAKYTPVWKMHRPWTRSMPSPPEEYYGTQTGNNFSQGQSSQQDSGTAFSQVCRLYEQSQQQHKEMMDHIIHMGNHREPYDFSKFY